VTDLEAIEIIYNLAVRSMRGPLPDRELDAIFHVRALLARKNQIIDYGEYGDSRDEAAEWR
jgi:hypothetical protein